MRLLPFCVLFLFACPAPLEPLPDAGDLLPDAGAEPPDAGVTPDAGTREVVWEPCPLHTGETGTAAECTVLQTPLEATNPSGPTLDYFVKRYRPAGGRGLRALWMLQGGPGASGLVFETLAEQFATRFPDVDYYFPDHRGTGRSSRVGCPVQEGPASGGGSYITDAEWPACIAAVQAQLGTKLAAFNTTNAANDVHAAIEAVKRPMQPVFIYGVSYGTWVAHRYLQLFPSHVDGVVLDSIVAPGMASLYRQDEDANEAARDYFGVCSADPLCKSKLGDDAWQKAQTLFTNLKAGHCSAIAVPGIDTHVALRRAFGGFLMDATFRSYIAPVVYRATRCEPRDVTALKQFMAQITAQPTGVPLEHQLWGWVVSQNILHSEMGETPVPTPAFLEAIREGAVCSRDVTLGFEATLGWPRYTPDAYVGQYAVTQTPMLMLQGGLDPATLLRKARAMKPHFTGAHQTWVELPSATHTTLVSSPFVNTLGERRSCGTGMLMAFLENPTGTLDTSCVAKVEGINFAVPYLNYNQAFFGTTDPWE